MKPRLILLNAPPRSGKDTFVEIFELANDRQTFHFKFAEPIRAALEAVFYPPLPEGEDYDKNIFRQDKYKDMRMKELGFEKPRDAMIRFSEDFMKPFFGRDIFPRLLWEKITKWSEYECDIIVSDLGFQQELDLLWQNNVANDSAFDIHLVHIHRPDCTYQNDSRKMIAPTPVTKFAEIYNNGTLEFLGEQICEAFNLSAPGYENDRAHEAEGRQQDYDSGRLPE